VRIENTFDVEAAPDAAWALLSDVPRVVPCMPGAELERSVDQRTWEVLQRVRLGPISLEMRAEVQQAELDEIGRRAVLAVKAKEVRGRGGAEATIESRLEEVDGGGTHVALTTELTLQGAVAQYGRPVVGTVAAELTRQFAACLAKMLETEATAGVAESSNARKGTSAPQAQPVGGFGLFFRSFWRRLSPRR
jgi:carbon monoxide dehydrogenase subunit G